MKPLIGLFAAAGLLYLGLVWIRPPVAPDVPLPRLFAGSEPPAPDGRVTVTVERDGTIRVDGRRTEVAGLRAALEEGVAALNGSGRQHFLPYPVYLRVDRAAPFSAWRPVLHAAAGGIGTTDVMLAGVCPADGSERGFDWWFAVPGAGDVATRVTVRRSASAPGAGPSVVDRISSALAATPGAVLILVDPAVTTDDVVHVLEACWRAGAEEVRVDPAPAASAGGDRLEVLVDGRPARLPPSWPLSPDPLPGLSSTTDGD